MEKSIIKINKVFFAVMFLFILMIPLVLSASNYNVEVIDVSPTNLVPGEETELQFVIENTGNKDIDNLVFLRKIKVGIFSQLDLAIQRLFKNWMMAMTKQYLLKYLLLLQQNQDYMN